MAAANLQPVSNRTFKCPLPSFARQRRVYIKDEARIRPRRLEGRQMHDIAPQEELLAAALDHVATMTGRMAWQRHHRDARSDFTAGDRVGPPAIGSSGLLRPLHLRT